jgi:hypothetical protein
MSRITKKDLRGAIELLNRATNSPAEHACLQDGKWKSNVGNFHLSCAYGGYALHRTANESGGVSDVFQCGHVPARALYALIHAYRRGFELAKGTN